MGRDAAARSNCPGMSYIADGMFSKGFLIDLRAILDAHARARYA